jgi:hypothetical protein
MPKATYRWKGKVMTKSTDEKRFAQLKPLLRYFVTIPSVAANLQ